MRRHKLRHKKCVNTPLESYNGYHGDSRLDGKGCIANRFMVIQIVVGKYTWM